MFPAFILGCVVEKKPMTVQQRLREDFQRKSKNLAWIKSENCEYHFNQNYVLYLENLITKITELLRAANGKTK